MDIALADVTPIYIKTLCGQHQILKIFFCSFSQSKWRILQEYIR